MRTHELVASETVETELDDRPLQSCIAERSERSSWTTCGADEPSCPPV